MPLDADAAGRLAATDGLRFDDAPFRREHSLEAEIPFLQRALHPGWRLLPILIGAASGPSDIETLADALRPWCDGATLFVVSSDFTHFGPRFRYVPFETEVPRRIEQLDMGAVQPILHRDAAGFEAYVRRTGATICGRDAISVLLRILPDDVEGSLAAYDTSGRMTQSWDHSVSYASIVFRSPAAAMMTDMEQPDRTPEARPEGMPEDMEILFLGLLRRGPIWTPEVTPEVEALQEAHLANIERMRRSGELLVAGPFGDDGDL